MKLSDKAPRGRSRAVRPAVVRAIPAKQRAASQIQAKNPAQNGAAAEALAPSRRVSVATPFKMPAVRAPGFPDRVVDIRTHGAVGDGASDCTAAIAAAINACASAGGGRVLIPAGKWLTGAIHLRSNIDLHLDEGAIVCFSADPSHYLPPVFVRWNGIECFNYSPLIYARDCTNIAITGHGLLLGNGKPWSTFEKSQKQSRAKLYEMMLAGVPADRRCFGSEQSLRPQFIMPINCTNVLLEDFTIAEAGPFWTIHVVYSRNVLIRRLKIATIDGANTDGIDIDSSRNVIIEDCDVATGVDCIALKSGMNEEGQQLNRPTENVVIRRVRATAGQGGFTIGSDMSGGVRNVFVHDCEFDSTSVGIRMKAARGRGGVVEAITIQNIRMSQIPDDAIQITTEFDSFVKPDGRAPTFRNIHIKNITCDHSGSAARLIGQSDAPFREINLENLDIHCDEGLSCVAANGMNLVNVRIVPRLGPVLSLRDTQQVLIDGLNGVTRNGVFLDLRGRQTRNIRLTGEASDTARPAIVLGIDVPRDAIVQE